MKQIFSLFILLFVLLFFSCKDDGGSPSITEVEKTTHLLTGESVTTMVADQWSVNSIDVDGLNYTDEFKDFTIKFTDDAYTATNGTVIFGTNGTWAFTDETAKILVIDGSLELELVELTEATLVFAFNWDETLYGKREAVAGRNTFTMNR